MTPTVVPLVPRSDDWVDAAPFRAHLRLLCETGLPWPVIALHAGLSVRHAHALLYGRRGRPVRRLPRPAACSLLQVTAEELHRLRRAPAPVEPTSHRLASLFEEGACPVRTARELRWTGARLEAVLEGRAAVTWEEALRVRVLLETSDRSRIVAVAARAA